MNLNKRIYKNELLDSDDIPFADIKQNMQELNTINTLLGGHTITISGVRKLAAHKRQITVCEIGCGGGDNLAAIAKALPHASAGFIGIDVKKECIDFAKAKNQSNFTAEWITSDYRHVQFDQKPDIIFSSLFCHHFTEDQLVQQLRWMHDNSRIGFFINDLERNTIAYHSIKLLTKFFSKSYLVKNDAPLSVARGFKKSEWINIFKRAGLAHYSIAWKWAFRYLILYKHES